jgi:N-acetylmuramoyl-L-alanine amidase CwlA
MSTYNKYQITENLIPGLPQNPFETANKKAAGVVMHATANYAAGNDTADGERNYEAGGAWQNAYAHTFTDDQKIEKIADFNYGAWHAFHYANTHFLGNELCQFTDAARFAASYDRWVWLAARQLFDLGLAPQDKVTLWSHLEISQTYQGNHEDPISYLASHGKTWDNVVADVTAYYNAMVAEKQASASKPVNVQTVPNSDYVGKTLTSKVDGLWFYNTPRWDVCDGTGNKGDSWIVTEELTVNGGRMLKCLDGKYRTADPKYVDVNPKPLEWPYTVEVDGITLKEAQEIVNYIGQQYKDAKANGIPK